MIRQVNISVLTTMVSLVLTACEKPADEVPCDPCSTAAQSEFTREYFRLLLNDRLEPVLVRYDSVSGESERFTFCTGAMAAEMLETVELTQVIRAAGTIMESCAETAQPNVAVERYEIVHHCLPEISYTSVSFPLYGTWFIHYVEDADTLLYPPCEGDSFLQLLESSTAEGTASINSFAGPFIRLSDSTLYVDDYAQTLQIGTGQQSAFESLFFTVYQRGSTLRYAQEGNSLTLTNRTTNTSIRFYMR